MRTSSPRRPSRRYRSRSLSSRSSSRGRLRSFRHEGDRDRGWRNGRSRSRDRYKEAQRSDSLYRSSRDYRSDDRYSSRYVSTKKRRERSLSQKSKDRPRSSHAHKSSLSLKGTKAKPSDKRNHSTSKRSHRSSSTASKSSNAPSTHSHEGANGDNDLTEEQLLTKLMGFSHFDTTKGEDHTRSDLSGVSRKTKRKYRQYMNRKGGFNRPLSPTF